MVHIRPWLIGVFAAAWASDAAAQSGGPSTELRRFLVERDADSLVVFLRIRSAPSLVASRDMLRRTALSEKFDGFAYARVPASWRFLGGRRGGAKRHGRRSLVLRATP